MTNPDIMSIREMIDLAFGDNDKNQVNFKLIETVLFLLARQLRVLDRKVKMIVGPTKTYSGTSLSVTEIKIQAKRKAGRYGKKMPVDKAKATSGPPFRKKNVPPEEADESGSSSVLTSALTLTDDKKPKTRTLKIQKPGVNQKLVEDFEVRMERYLRTIYQRSDSREEPKDEPTPMGSVNDMQYEKLLVVERVPSEEVKNKRPSTSEQKLSSILSVVTQEQFNELVEKVQQVQAQFGVEVGRAKFPENAELLEELRKGASLTDAMAALQMSARLEAAEKTLEKMMSLVTDIAVQTGIDVPVRNTATEVVFSDRTKSYDINADKKPAIKQPPRPPRPSQAPSYAPDSSKERTSTLPPVIPLAMPSAIDQVTSQTRKENMTGDEKYVTRSDLGNELDKVHDDIIKLSIDAGAKAMETANAAMRTVNKLAQRVDNALSLNDRMHELENFVAEYAEKVTELDTGLTSQMSDYQEQLTQMQHTLENGLDNMAEALANVGSDTTAVDELNARFNVLYVDIDNMQQLQAEMKEVGNKYELDLRDIVQQIEVLRDQKSDRDEVTDALKDKAGLDTLNGIVMQDQFDAVCRDLSKRIYAAYHKFNNQELVWQKAIDDLQKDINEKMDLSQLATFTDSIHNNFEKLSRQMQAMIDIIGEPHSAAIAKRLSRDAHCIACGAPAVMDLVEPNIVPALPAMPAKRPPVIGADAAGPTDHGDYKPCYPGQPIPHPLDPRAHICNRYCGGSHTRTDVATLSRAPMGLVINQLRGVATEVGSDGKAYYVDNLRPCAPCNQPITTTPYRVADEAPVTADTVPKINNASFSSTTPGIRNSVDDLPPEDMRMTSLTAEVFDGDGISLVTPTLLSVDGAELNNGGSPTNLF